MKNKKLINSFKYAFNGLISSFKSERNMKIHILMMILVIICGIFFKISRLEWFILIILFMLVIFGELINTTIELIVDLISPERNIKAGLIKDIAAGSVLVLAIGSSIIGLLIFIPKLIILLK